jgi:two-component system cell cycle sensor histidine kinase/response regulator CckA
VYSEVGVGTTFKVYLLRVREAASPVRQKLKIEPRRGTETILLVEDESSVRRSRRATSSRRAIAYCQRATPRKR